MTTLSRGYIRLAFATLVASVIWLVALPMLSELPTVRARIESNRSAGINPTAVFYTDHPGMQDIERNIAARVESRGGSFWTIAGSDSANESE